MLHKLLLAVLLGAVVGLEREVRGKPAGVRTCSLVALASALFTILGVSFGDSSDPSRLAAAVIQGIGFLGAGTIIIYKEKIVGLTTSAIVWTVCAIGMACGTGHTELAVEVTAIVLAITLLVTPLERKFLNRNRHR